MKIIGVGLNKTGTKTLRHFLLHWGFRHQTYDLQSFRDYRDGHIEKLLKEMELFDSFEDWPWPLMYREIDQRFPDAKFVLTVRKSPEIWYQSLCKMAVRMGPLNDYEKFIYGYSMPQGRREEHIQFYENHNRDVENYFVDRPDKLLKICWGTRGDEGTQLANFLGKPDLESLPPNLNQSLPVYGGENLAWAHINRVAFQTKWKAIRKFRKWKRGIQRRLRLPQNN